MQQQTFYEVAQDIAILAGVCVGVFAVFSPSWVWFRKQLFGWGGGVLCAFGTVLIVASIFKTVSLGVGPNGMDLKLGQQIAELQKQVADVKTAASETNQKMAQVTSAVDKIGADRTTEVSQVRQQLDQLSGKITQLTQASESTAGQRVALAEQQRTQIRETVLNSRDAPRVSNPNFSVNVGTVVPRDKIHLVRVPEALVGIHPEWRGYVYFVYNDDIVIVNPRNMTIVNVLPAAPEESGSKPQQH